MQSLLGQLYSRITGSPEDIASEGLAYILQNSAGARKAINRLLEISCEIIFDDLRYVTQNIGKNLERPDISGYDDNSDEVLIIEAKFWAAMTDNQPVEYLSRLKNNSVLIFICPNLRKKAIYAELLNRINSSGLGIINKEPDNYRIVLEYAKNVLVKTWDEILGVIRIQLVQDNEQVLISDIDQLIGLCNTIDRNSFLPLRSEDLSPGIAKKISSYYDVVDKVIIQLKHTGLVNTTGLKATAQKYGYTRYFKIGFIAGKIELRLDFWEKHADTPFWLTFKEITPKGWENTKILKSECKKAALHLKYMIVEHGDFGITFALSPLLHQIEDKVVKDLADRVIKLADFIEKGLKAVNK